MTDKNQAKKMGINIIQSQQEKNPLFDMLLKNFSQTIKDNQVNLSAIKMLLGFNESMHDRIGYELTWTGKGVANALYSEPCQKQLKLQESFMPQTLASKHPNNAIIIGDNLDALKLLKSAYSEKIKMIYIDPPYNTGNRDFIYPDNFRQDYQKILREVGLMEIDENGEEIESESLKFFKNIQGSRTHSGWLSFMLPRLKLARDLLKEDGVIFISIDDNECANLKILCDEIFGEDNFVACLCVVDNLKGNNNTDGISQTNEYCLIYAKNREILKIGELKIQEDDENLQKWNVDSLGYWKEGRNIKGTGEDAPREKRPSMFYPIYLNDNMEISLEKSDDFYIEVLPITNGKEMRWNWGKDFLRNNKHELIVKKTEHGFNFIKKQRPILGDLPSKKLKTTCYSPKYSTSVSSNTIKKIFNKENVFNYSKSIYLIKDFLQISTTPNSNDIILDFFAGSGTTVHAVMELNAEDKGNREFILVQIDEEIKIKEDKSKSAYDFCKNVLKSAKPVISDITTERVKRAASKIIQSSKESALNCGFKVYTLEDKAQIANDKEGIMLFNHSHLTPFDKALNLALQCGKTLNQPLKIIIKDKLYQCEDAYFCIVCDEEVREYLAKSKNEMIFLDGYEEIDLQAFLNLNAGFKERLSVVY
ncbi:site-specific DNA-methyltransferase [Helicobacter pylori]|uniref:site-specific DNA-methyltransferase n=1 Tax=Helicobacter pylori TaxID=210 RepID=UPI00165C37AE|nr:site-specific DNA-methyltransferase [Helicobacter pylori]WQS21104.1 site-specific DNA-methyltransferase [Helicobacter pylori]